MFLKPYYSWLLIAALVVILDQITKAAATHYLSLYWPLDIAPFFNLTLSHNPGAAFSFLSHSNGWQRWLFTAVAIIMSGVILVWLRRIPAEDKLYKLALVLILGGALGNLIDRITLGYVIDFFDFYYKNWHFPVFNVADSAISCGAGLIVIDAIRSRKT